MSHRRLLWSVLTLLSAASAAPLVLANAPQAKPAPSAAHQLSADEIAGRVQGFYDHTKTFKAGFKQRYTMPAYNRTKDSTGSVIFQKPGKMSWRYANNGNRVVSDGKIIKIYERENKQMYEQPMDKTPYPAVLSFLTGGGDLRKSFKLRKLDARQMGFEGGYVLLGEPKEASPAYQKIFLYVDGGTYQVRRVILLDAQRNRNRFDFINPEVNVKTSAQEFSFVPPPGTQIIRP